VLFTKQSGFRMARLSVNNSLLHWAIERSNVPREVLEKKFPKIHLWISGKQFPTLKQIESFAKATSTPFGFFFLPEPPVDRLPIPHFRTIANDAPEGPSPDLLETVQTMEYRQQWMREYLKEQGHESLPFIGSASLEESPQLVAEKIRETLGLKQDWASQQPNWDEARKALCRIIENIGILIVFNGVVGNNTHRALSPSEFRGFVLVDEYAPLIFVNGKDGIAAQMFTIAHELAHVWYGRSAAFDLHEMQPANDQSELTCNKVAAEFLIPEIELKRLWPSISHHHDWHQRIAKQFKTSSLVAARRVLELNFISRNEFIDFYNAYKVDEQRRVRKKSTGGDNRYTQNYRVGQRFAKTVIGAVKEGRILYNEAYKLTGLNGKAFESYSKYLGNIGSN
jgi:Zn-dependent peptidase ImmA (M78 family)